jgi:biopolymer transport protein ExbD
MSTDKKYHPRPSLTFNMAPMIDVVFLLIIFFVLVSHFASAERVPLDLPDPDDSQALNIRVTDRVIINVRLADESDPSQGALYSVGPIAPEPLGVIAQRLTLHKRANPDVKVVIRADKRARYADVRDVMETVSELGIEQMRLVAHVGPARASGDTP